MSFFHELKEAFLHLLYPHTCAGCGDELSSPETALCLRCLHELPETGFAPLADNPAEKLFRGRLPLYSASAQYYFTRESLIQKLMHRFKYQGRRDLGYQLGRIMGKQLQTSGRFPVDGLIPLPLFPQKEKKRGYNQALVLCEGMAVAMQVPVLRETVIRPEHTETQTRKGRVERWINMEGKFLLQQVSSLENKHVLLVDDVVTTGATLESCGNELLKIPGLQLSLATLCIATR